MLAHTRRISTCCANIQPSHSRTSSNITKRDIANLALGNPDNHGRNKLRKHQDGTIRLAPLFDFAPMRLAKEGIVRSAMGHDA